MSFLIADNVKDYMQRFVEEMERSKNAQFQRNITETERKLKENVNHYQNLTKTLKNRETELHKYVNEITDKYVHLCHLMETEQTRVLEQHKDRLNDVFRKFQSDMNTYRLVLRNSRIQSMSDLEGDVAELNVEIQNLPKLSLFKFTKNNDAFKDLTHAFGDLNSGRDKKSIGSSHQSHLPGQSHRHTAPGAINGQDLDSTTNDSSETVKCDERFSTIPDDTDDDLPTKETNAIERPTVSSDVDSATSSKMSQCRSGRFNNSGTGEQCEESHSSCTPASIIFGLTIPAVCLK